MKKLIALCIILVLSFSAALSAEEIPADEKAVRDETAKEETVKEKAVNEQTINKQVSPVPWDSVVVLPVNLYDTFAFDPAKGPYIRAGMLLAGPVFITVWGFAEWGWGNQDSLVFKAHNVWGANALDGASDKFGHALASYYITKEAAFLYRATGYSRLWANIAGALYAESVMGLMEIGDGFSTAQGFDFNDFIFNNIGIAVGLIMSQFPVLDRMFAFQWEYVPTKRYRRSVANNKYTSADFFTDYSGQKVILATKLGGIPYLSRTPLRYMNIDLGYYARGYYNKDFSHNTRNMYLGVSINYSIAFGDLLPVSYTSSFLQTTFNYVHVPLDIEAKTWEFTKSRND